ncbi:multicopper oxidase [Thozetella sp. PMI_491]|nr:multicopper oxidase [Thozetella sp. PMI_491]
MLLSLTLASTLLAGALALPQDLKGSRTIQERATCTGNTASTRSQWCDYDISTDYYEEVPDTGVTREYWFELTDATVAPDGVSRVAQAINGSIPGPTIIADWGDTVIVHLTNALSSWDNGTSIHFHGIRQNYTNQNDGVPSITQCPVAIGDSITYTWKATQYGSSWYHSHFGLQAWEGVFGGILINGPATANYDEDLGHVFLNDWDHSTADELYLSAESSGPPTLDNGLINGTNVYGDDDSSTQTGTRFNVSFTSGTSYRMRLVNAAIDTHWKFMIDDHTMQVIATDLVPITPYNTTVLSIGMGQRYDIIVTADQASTADNFWMRAIPQAACSDNDSTDNIKGIVYYGSTPGTPSTSAYSYTDSCTDEDVSSLVPYLSKTVDAASWDDSEAATVGKNSANLFKWYLNSTTMLVDWADPTLNQIYEGNTSYTTSDAVVQLDTADEWVYVAITTTMAVPHPIHLHGFDFFVLAQGTGTYSSSVTLNLDNPPRRDTAMLPASGYVVIAFKTDNPGAWLMHCHIGWHTSEGFAMQWVVRESEITSLIDYDSLSSTCSAWSTYADSASITQEDSGL